jgi:hypothetical protein
MSFMLRMTFFVKGNVRSIPRREKPFIRGDKSVAYRSLLDAYSLLFNGHRGLLARCGAAAR